MPKRKEISVSGKTTTKKLKTSQDSFESQLSFDSARQCFQSLIYPTTIEEFFEKNWEKKVAHLQRKNNKYYGGLFTKSQVEALVKKENFEYDIDLFVSRYTKDGNEIDAEGQATVKNFQKYMKDKATIMLSRPHRFSKELHKLLQLLEVFFGSCVFAHVEINPPASQGHAPSYSDKEILVLQLEGKKRWQMYKIIKELPIEESDDLDESEIGEVIQEYVTEPGDLLYFPRGTVLQAVALPGEHSTDISIEVSNENYWGNFISNIVDKALNRAIEEDVTFRQQLPFDYYSYMGFAKKEKTNELQDSTSDENKAEKGKAAVPEIDKSDIDKQNHFEEKLKKMLVSLTKYLDPHWGADRLGTWFMGNRLPPYDISEKHDDGDPPDDESMIQLTYPEHIRIIYNTPGDGLMEHLNNENDEDDEDNDEDDEVMEEDEKNGKEKEKKDKNKNVKPVKKDSKEETTEKKPKKGSTSKKETEKSKKEAAKSKKDADKKTKNNNKEDDEDDVSDDDDDEGMEEDDELDDSFNDEPCIILQHSLKNNSDEDSEMITPSVIKFPVHYADALLILHRSTQPIAVKDLPLIPDERNEMVVMLWSQGLLNVSGD